MLNDLQKVILPTGIPQGWICLRDAGRMHRRLTGEFGNCAHFHVMSRVAGGAMLFGDEEKEAFRLLMWWMAKFSGVEVLTYCVMGNHFHLLIRIPRREAFLGRFVCDTPGVAGERRLLEHLRLLYSKAYLSRLESDIKDLRREGREAEVQRVLDRYKDRFCDLSLFVKELKERFSRWFNKKHGRRGISAEAAREVISAGGQLGHFDLVRCRVRWFMEGAALGSESFLRRVLGEIFGEWRLRSLPIVGKVREEREESGSNWFSLCRLRGEGVS